VRLFWRFLFACRFFLAQQNPAPRSLDAVSGCIAVRAPAGKEEGHIISM